MSLNDFAAASRIPFDRLVINKNILDKLMNQVSLNFTMQLQTQSNWCWAATSVSVSRFYNPLSGWTQCKVASAEQNINSCCNSPLPAGCNVYWYLDKSLKRVNCYNTSSGPISWEAVKAEIAAGRPVGVRTAWSGGGAHFLCIYGVQQLGTTKYFMLDDPIYGKSVATVANFTNSYRGSGSWTHTYLTKKPPVMIFNIKEYTIKPEWLNLIQEVQPLVKPEGASTKSAAGESAGATATAASTITASHPVYVLGLDALKSKTAVPGNAALLRMVELGPDQQLSAAYDITMPDQPTTELKNVQFQPEYLQSLKTALDKTIDTAKAGEGEAKLKMLSIPALYTEAYWLHYEDSTKDMVIPMRSFGLFKENEPVPYAQFIKVLQDQAATIPNTNDNELGG